MHMYVCVYTHTWCEIVRDRATREVRLVSGDIPSAAILSEHTVITNQVRDHTDTGSVKGVRRSSRGQMAASVTSISSDHTVATDHRTRITGYGSYSYRKWEGRESLDGVK